MVLKLLSFLTALVPARLAYALGRALGLLWYYGFRFRLGIIRSNLELAFGSERTPQELERIARANCMHYGMNLVDFILSVGWTRERYAQVPLEGGEHLEKALAEGKGAYILCTHLGVWELVPGLAAYGFPFDLIVKRPRTPWMDRFLTWNRQKTGCRTLAETKTATDALRALSQNRAVGFVLDQFMGPPIGLPVTFFGHQAGTAVGLALLSEKREAPILLLYNYRDRDGFPRAVIESPIEWHDLPTEKNQRLYYKTQIFNDMIERIIRKYPEQWLWIHRRWKAYRGEPRWLLAGALAALLCVISGCMSNPGITTELTSPTGQGVPAEPVVAIPKEAPMQEEPQKTLVGPSIEPAKELPKQAKSKKGAVVVPALPDKKKLVKRRFEAADLPFEVGERQVLDLNWTMIPAGRLTLEVRPDASDKFGGRPTFHFWGNARSSKIVDAIYKVDNTIQSYIDKEWFLPYKFLLTMDEAFQFKQTRVVFDHTKNIAHYWSDRKSQKWGNDVQNRQDPLAPNALDMYGAMYYARLLNYRLNEKQQFMVYENGKNLTITLTPVANEVVMTPAGTFQCWKILTTVALDNVLKSAGDMYAWLSDDFKKYIVKFDAQLKIGSLKGILVELRDRSLAGRQ